MTGIIELNGLCKSFGEVKALQSLSLRVKEGELFAFLGVNGAGKSTAINIICGTLAADAGEVFICGETASSNPDAVKRSLGVVFQGSVLDKALTVADNLKMRAALYGITGKAFEERLDELDSLISVRELMKRPVGKLSGGQRRRVDIVRALIHHPKILILDEPTTGLDPQTRRLLWDAVSKMRKEQHMTVFLTTHYMEEAADADYVVIIDGGKKAAEGTPLELKNAYTGDFITIYGITEAQAASLGKPYTLLRDACRIEVANTAEATELIVENPALFCDYEITKGRMDDVFLAVTGKQLSGGN